MRKLCGTALQFGVNTDIALRKEMAPLTLTHRESWGESKKGKRMLSRNLSELPSSGPLSVKLSPFSTPKGKKSVKGTFPADLVQRREKIAKTGRRREAMTICRGIGKPSTRHKIQCRTLSDGGDFILAISQMQLVNIDYS
jgi:hypothetical protein